MSDYTPTTEEMRGNYVSNLFEGGGSDEARAEWDYERENGEQIFDRWLAAHDAEKRAEWEAEQGKPAPCVMTHTPPFDFAQCETHDETFPLGDVCKWHGKESVTEVLQDEVDEQRARAVRAEHQLEILRAEQGEPEWEYGTRCAMPECTEPHLLGPGDEPPLPEESLWRRTVARDVPAGPWEPVTNTESEG